MRRRFGFKERRRTLLVPVALTLDLITTLERGTIFWESHRKSGYFTAKVIIHSVRLPVSSSLRNFYNLSIGIK